MSANSQPEVFLTLGARTPIGSFQGSLSSFTAVELGSKAIRETLSRAQVSEDQIDEVIFGNVVQAGQGQNPARQATLGAGLPLSVGSVTVNRVCGSGLQAVIYAEHAIRLGEAQMIVAGGMESMSNTPHLLPKARQGYRMGDGVLVDSMLRDGLSNAYDGASMGVCGDQTAQDLKISREEQDDFAVRSYTLTQQAHDKGWAAKENFPIEVQSRKQTLTVKDDEEYLRFNEEKLRQLRPVFSKEGTVTAGNASTISDGAASLLVLSKEKIQELGVQPVARIVGSASFSQQPEQFTTAPIGANQRLLDRLGWKVSDVDLFEINEAFAVVALAAQKELNIPLEKLNVHGGAISMGHPIGASGARTLITLLNAMQINDKKRGIVSLCVGGGEAVALAVESV